MKTVYLFFTVLFAAAGAASAQTKPAATPALSAAPQAVTAGDCLPPSPLPLVTGLPGKLAPSPSASVTGRNSMPPPPAPLAGRDGAPPPPPLAAHHGAPPPPPPAGQAIAPPPPPLAGGDGAPPPPSTARRPGAANKCASPPPPAPAVAQR